MTEQEIAFTIANKDDAEKKAEKIWFVKELVDSTDDLSEEDRDLLTETIYAGLHVDRDDSEKEETPMI